MQNTTPQFMSIWVVQRLLMSCGIYMFWPFLTSSYFLNFITTKDPWLPCLSSDWSARCTSPPQDICTATQPNDARRTSHHIHVTLWYHVSHNVWRLLTPGFRVEDHSSTQQIRWRLIAPRVRVTAQVLLHGLRRIEQANSWERKTTV